MINHKRRISILVAALLTFAVGSAFAQSAGDTADRRFHDDLLNNFVGEWEAVATGHKVIFTLNFEVKWVLNHQYLRVHFKSNEVIPWLKVPFESDLFLDTTN